MEKRRVAVAMFALLEAAAVDSEAMRTGSPAMQKTLQPSDRRAFSV